MADEPRIARASGGEAGHDIAHWLFARLYYVWLTDAILRFFLACPKRFLPLYFWL